MTFSTPKGKSKSADYEHDFGSIETYQTMSKILWELHSEMAVLPETEYDRRLKMSYEILARYHGHQAYQIIQDSIKQENGLSKND